MSDNSASNKKGRPTPTRQEQEAARQRPLIGDRKAAKEKLRLEREKAQLGMEAGEERYLLPRDKGPQRRYVRDFVDARFNLGEMLIPVMLGVMLLLALPDPIPSFGMVLLWVCFAASIVDLFFMGRILKNRMREKFGADKLDKGHLWYASMRALQLRILRLPKPQRKYGNYPN